MRVALYYPEVSCFEPPMKLDAVVAALDVSYVVDAAVVDVHWLPAVNPTSAKAPYCSADCGVTSDGVD